MSKISLPSFNEITKGISLDVPPNPKLPVLPPLQVKPPNRAAPIDHIENTTFNYLVHFFSCSDILAESLRQLELNFMAITKPGCGTDKSLVYGKSADNETWATSRNDYRTFVAGIPPDISQNIPTALSRLAEVLDMLCQLKQNYPLQDQLQGQGHHETTMLEYKEISSDKEPTTNTYIPLKTTIKLKLKMAKLRKQKAAMNRAAKSKGKKASRCSHCAVADSPEWRRGPDGSRTLCNACGLFYSKLLRKFGPDTAEVVFNFKKLDNRIGDRIVPSESEKNQILKRAM